MFRLWASPEALYGPRRRISHETFLTQAPARSAIFGLAVASTAWALLACPESAQAQAFDRPMPGDEPLRGSFAAPPGQPAPSAISEDNWPPKVLPGWKESKPRGRPAAARQSGRPPLPELAPYRTSPSLKKLQPLDDPIAYPAPEPPLPTPAEAAIPTQPPGKRPLPEADPYAPLGVRAGAFLLRPSLEQSLGYDSNPNRIPGAKKGSAATKTEAALSAQSDWTTHSLNIDLRGSYAAFPSVRDSGQPEGAARALLRLDVNRATTIELENRAALSTLAPSSPETAGATGRSRVLVLGGSAALARTLGVVDLKATLSAEHTQYEDGRLAGGGVLPLSRDDFAAYALKTRAAYHIGTAFNPFVETIVDLRRHDSATDANGLKRDSNGVVARIGNSFDITRTLTGEVSAGVLRRNYDEPTFRPVTGPSLDAILVWQASPLTRITLKGGTEIGETNLLNSSGVAIRRAEVEIAHAARRNLTFTANARYSKSIYDGVALQQDLWGAGFKAEYNLTRTLAIRGTYTHELLRSSAPASNYSADTFLLGLRVQR